MRRAEIISDEEGYALAKACAADDRLAQRRLWEIHKNLMFGICLRFTGTRQEAEDLLQEVFVRVFQSIGSYRGQGSLEGWIRRIAVRTAIYEMGKQQLETQNLDAAAWEVVMKKISPEDHPDTDDAETGKLLRLLRDLPPGFRTVLNLYAIEEYSHEEIARELGISIGASKSQLHRAKAYMRRLLNKTMMFV